MYNHPYHQQCTTTHITNNVQHCFSESGIWKHDLEVFKEPVRDKTVPAPLQNTTVQETDLHYMCERGNKTHLTCHERLTLTNTSTRNPSPNSASVSQRSKKMTTSFMSKWESISIIHVYHVLIFSFLTHTHTHSYCQALVSTVFNVYKITVIFPDYMFYGFYLSIIRIWVFEPWYGCRYSDSIRAWQSGNRNSVRTRYFAANETCPAAKPSLYTTRTGVKHPPPFNTGVKGRVLRLHGKLQVNFTFVQLVSISTQKVSSTDRLWASIRDAAISDLSYATSVLTIFCGSVQHHEGEFCSPSNSRG